jgi:putative ABC transport system permease protein
MPRLARDVRLITRQFSKNPGFAAMVVCCLGLGMGATAAIFSLVHAVVLRPLPFPEPDRLVWLQLADHTPGAPPNASASLSYPDYFDWRGASRSFDGVASYRNNTFVLTGVRQPQQLQGTVVSANFFRVLGVRPIAGRDFLPEEEKPGSHVVMLSHAVLLRS